MLLNTQKKYASNKKLSLSKLIETYLDSSTREQEDEFEISPFVRSISSEKSILADFGLMDKNEANFSTFCSSGQKGG